MKTAYSVIIYSMLTLSCLGAGWDTNAWSSAGTDTNGLTIGSYHRYYLDASTNKVFIKEVMSTDAFAAIEERAEISGVSAATTNVWFRNNRADLVNIKSWIVSNADEFYEGTAWTNNWNAYSTNAGSSVDWVECPTYLLTSDNSTDLVNIGTSNNAALAYSTGKIVASLSLASNYFTSTPWRSLTSTNTANGWHPIDDILNLLVYPIVDVNADNSLRWDNRGETNLLIANNSATPNTIPGAGQYVWADTKSWWNTNTSTIVGAQLRPRKFSYGNVLRGGGNKCRFRATFRTLYAYPICTIASSATNYTANLSYYVFATAGNDHHWPSWSGSHTEWFDSQGGSYVAGENYVFTQTNVTAVGLFTNTTAIGDTGLSAPTWTGEPDGGAGSTDVLVGDYGPESDTALHQSSLGYQIADLKVLADYINSSSPITYYAD